MRQLIIVLFVFFTFQVANAQLSTSIGNLKIGHTELVDGIKLLKSIDEESIYFESNGQILVNAHNFPFAGIKWSDIIASFKNSTLIRVQLNVDGFAPSESLNLFEKLNTAFLSKYNDYLVYSSASVYMYKDSYVEVLLSYDVKNNSITVTYTYKHKPQIGEGI